MAWRSQISCYQQKQNWNRPRTWLNQMFTTIFLDQDFSAFQVPSAALQVCHVSATQAHQILYLITQKITKCLTYITYTFYITHNLNDINFKFYFITFLHNCSLLDKRNLGRLRTLLIRGTNFVTGNILHNAEVRLNIVLLTYYFVDIHKTVLPVFTSCLMPSTEIVAFAMGFPCISLTTPFMPRCTWARK